MICKFISTAIYSLPMTRYALFLMLPLIAVSCSVQGSKEDPNA
jgi:hypothetical protein